jgi:hypothetical protein
MSRVLLRERSTFKLFCATASLLLGACGTTDQQEPALTGGASGNSQNSAGSAGGGGSNLGTSGVPAAGGGAGTSSGPAGRSGAGGSAGS